LIQWRRRLGDRRRYRAGGRRADVKAIIPLETPNTGALYGP
jgi:hypothetical protein